MKKFKVNTIETEIWKRSYLVEAIDEQDAKQKIYDGDYYWLEEMSEIDKEITKIKLIDTKDEN